MTKIPVSVVVITKNEERNIEQCLRSLAAFDQVFVVDSQSTDRTVELGQAHGAEVVAFTWSGGYPKKKQWALENLPFRHRWTLLVDADEEVTQELCDEIRALMEGTPAHAGYWVDFDYVFLDRRLRHGLHAQKLVLFDRQVSRWVPCDDLDAVHSTENEYHYQPVVDGSTVFLRGRILHHDHDELYHYFERVNRYTDWEAVVRRNGALERLDAPPSRFDAVVARLARPLPFKAALAFVDSLILRRGFLDGRAGFHFAVARGFYYWQMALKGGELARRDAGERVRLSAPAAGSSGSASEPPVVGHRAG